MLLLAVATVLVVNEVLYDPPGTDGGREFVEVLCLSPVALAGWSLESGDGARRTWRLVWRGDAASGALAPGTLFVVGGDSVAGAAARLGGELQNGPDALRLVDPHGAVHDRVGWGALDDAAFFETRSAPDVSGQSLGRDPDGIDTDDNERDFGALSPSPGRPNRARRNLAVALVAPDPLFAWPGRPLRAIVRVHNRGRESIATWDVAARWQRASAAAASDTLATRALGIAGPRGVALAPGDSALLVVGCGDGAGLHRLAVRGAFADEDSTDDDAAAWVRIGAGDVVVDEILYAPHTGEPEWIEITNRSSVALRPAGCTLADRSGRRATVRGAAVLGPGARAIVAADTTTAIRGLAPGTLRFAATPWPSLNDTGDGDWADALVWRDATGIVQDACGYPPDAGERGRSLERTSVDPGRRGVGWAACTAPGGATPGAPNSVSSTAPTGDGATAVANPVFSPDGDGRDDRLVVRVTVPPECDRCRVEIFDLEGRRRARLAADALGPGARDLAWDGVDDSGLPVEAGAYILYFECHSKSGTRLRERRAIGVVRP
jgi:hypothetical protein